MNQKIRACPLNLNKLVIFLHRLRDIEGIKPSMRGKRVSIISQDKDNCLIELLEDAGRYKAGQKIMSFTAHIEEVKENDSK